MLDPIELVDVAADSGPTIVTITDSINAQSIPYNSATMGQGTVINIPAGTFNYGYQGGTGPATVVREVQQSTVNPLDSNDISIARGVVTQPVNTAVDSQTGNLTFTGAPKGGSFATNAAYFLTSVNQAVMATQIGIALGKGFDQYLYDSNPDYWDSIGMSSLNPETWGSITYEDDSLGASLFNMIFGIDPATGNAQAYADADAFAYVAQCLNNAGIFSSGGFDVSWPVDSAGHTYSVTRTPTVYPVSMFTCSYESYGAHGRGVHTVTYIFPDDTIGCFYKSIVGGTPQLSCTVSTRYPNSTFTQITNYPDGYVETRTRNFEEFYDTAAQRSGYYPRVYFKQLYEYIEVATSIPDDWFQSTDPMSGITITGDGMNETSNRAYILYMGGCVSFGEVIPTVPGVETQQGAVVPNTSDWTDLENIANSLRLQYPELFTNALTYDVPDSQGNIIEKTYVPVAWPNTATNPWTDTQPTTDTNTQTQLQTLINLLTEPATRTQTVTDTLTQPVNISPTGTVPPAENPINTGSGSSPVPVSTTGSSSKLWSVYHPTQAQVDAFGAWLWSTNFIDQLMKMFQNPMEGIISLHKIFATPVDAGTGNIVVGTLDSGVSSATVTQQYVYVSCGSVTCSEDFGNVFDYNPHTTVSLYLPFVGIVPLDVDDVMRSTITVTYGVDIFTGACLAMVEVSRDNATVTMYQYSGVCSVEYPLSNVQQSQLMSGLLTLVSGGAAIATGGMSLAAGAAVAGGLAATQKASIGRSGGFGGNSGAMGIKKPYLIITRPQTKIAEYFPAIDGYPTNVSGSLSDFSGQVVVEGVHVEGIAATEKELSMIENALRSGVLV